MKSARRDWMIVGVGRRPAGLAHCDKAHIEVGGATIPVSAEQLHGAEREAAWQTLTAGIPRFSKYAEKTDREIPVIRLTPRSN